MKLKKNELKIIQLLLASPDYISTYDIDNKKRKKKNLIKDKINNFRNNL